MKHILTLFCIGFATALHAATIQFSDLTTRTSLTTSDIIPFDWNDTGTFKTRGMTAANFATSIGSLLDLANTYQAKDATLGALAGLTIASGKMIYGTGTDAFSTIDTTSFGRGLLNSADAAAVLSTLGTASLYQGLDATLTALAGLTTSSGKMIYATGSDTFSTVDSTSFGRSVLNAADAAALRTLAGISTQWTTASNNSTFTNTVPDLGGSNYIFLTNQITSADKRWFGWSSSGAIHALGNTTGWTGGSDYVINFPYADGQNLTVDMHAASGLVPVVPDISTHAGEVLAVNGTGDDFEWVTTSSLPSQTGNNGKFLTTNGSAASWANVNAANLEGLGTNVGAWLGTPSSGNLASAVTDETGSGALVFGTSPDFTTGITIGGVAVPTISSTSTLTNKTISGASNTLTNIGNASLTNSAVTIGSTSISLGATSTSLAGLTGLGVASGTITSSSPQTLTQTWNSAGVTFDASTIDVTDTASASGSRLLNLKVGGVSKFYIDKTGRVTATTGTLSGQWDFGGVVTAVSEVYANGGIILGGSKAISRSGAGMYFNMTDLAGTGHSNPAWIGAGSAGSCNWLVFNNYTFSSTVWEALRMGYTSNVAYLRSEAGSTGTVRNIVIGAGASAGTNVAGATTTITAGTGTGTGTISTIVLQSPQATTSGSSAQSSVTGLTIINGTAKMASYTVATLPSASASGAGAMAFVSDATQAQGSGSGSAPTGGGSNGRPVFSDGTNWVQY